MKVSSTLSRYEIMVTNDGVCYREKKIYLYDKCTHLFFQQDLSRKINITLVKSRRINVLCEAVKAVA